MTAEQPTAETCAIAAICATECGIVAEAGGFVVLDLAPWLSPLDGENPSGASLRDDPALPRDRAADAARGCEIVRDERNNPVSDVTVPVDWARVMEGRGAARRGPRPAASRHRRAGAPQRAGPRRAGRRADPDRADVEVHWDTLHPELRAGSPIPARRARMRRVNALLQLENADERAPRRLRRRTVFITRGLGPVARPRPRARRARRPHGAERSRAGDERRASARELVAEHEQLVGRVRAACAALADQAPGELAGS